MARTYRYVFRHRVSGEIKTATAHSQNAARNLLGGLSSSWWMPWECYTIPVVFCGVNERPVWYYTADGKIHDGARP